MPGFPGAATARGAVLDGLGNRASENCRVAPPARQVVMRSLRSIRSVLEPRALETDARGEGVQFVQVVGLHVPAARPLAPVGPDEGVINIDHVATFVVCSFTRRVGING